MVNVVLIRHGAVINPYANQEALYGKVDVELSPLGKEEATRAAVAVGVLREAGGATLVVHTGLRRTVFGAAEVTKVLEEKGAKVTVVCEPRLEELDRGAWAGMTKSEILAAYEAEGVDPMKALALDDEFRPKDGENFKDLRARVLPAFDEMVTRCSASGSEAVVCVAHNWVIRCILAACKNLPPLALYDMSTPTASLTCIRVEDGAKTIVFEGVKP